MEWISVKDRLPQEGVKVLTVDSFDEYRLDYIVSFSESDFIWACRKESEMMEVTHWMPLPQPPK